MRIPAFALALALLASPALAETIKATDAASHVGQSVTVEGFVSNVFASHVGTVFVDMEGRYPKSAFSGVIFASDVSKFPDRFSWIGRTVDITGMIKLYKGKPEIILTSPSPISVVP